MTNSATGERLIVDQYQASVEDYVIYLMHMATYRFAQRFTERRTVLDYGCGSGYGSALIADGAESVTGVDVAAEAIDYAQRHYQHENLRYLQVSQDAALPFAADAFDVVMSFQVLEHVRNPTEYIAEVKRVLRPGGRLLLVTPDRTTRLLPFQRPWNRWHLYEYSPRTLHTLIAKHFDSVELLKMSGRREAVAIELRRCNKVKWLTLPVTLPILPDAFRVGALNAIHRLRGKPKAKLPAVLPDFNETDFHIGAELSPSLNLVACAVKVC